MNKWTSILVAVAFGFAGTACAPRNDSPGQAMPDNSFSLAGTIWQVEDIDRGGVIDNALVTLQFVAADGIAGFTGCNRYFGTAAINGESVSFTGIGSTRRACVPAVMNQEQRLLAALGDIRSWRMDADTWLLLFDADGRQRLKLIGIESDPTAEAVAAAGVPAIATAVAVPSGTASD